MDSDPSGEPTVVVLLNGYAAKLPSNSYVPVRESALLSALTRALLLLLFVSQ